ncbi:hypothetical protein GIB67_035665 [Kingdonia uniflora]|uniref:Serpin domain-containing protein n=1 Tax=Kingdonia uniflora TaxID=39325 RepID=A0A7J7KVH0_9MAGN|nr:hypothetical protein GIB67_035665 [Kingdonia uniflora]
MYIILPHKKDRLWNLVKKVHSNSKFMKKHATELYKYVSTGEFMIPKFKISFGFQAKKDLKEGRLNLPFSNSVELDGMVKGLLSKGYLNVSEILHRSVIEVNEEGIVAATPTLIIHVTRSMVIEEIESEKECSDPDVEVNRWIRHAQIGIDCLGLEDGYYSTHSSQDGDYVPTAEELEGGSKFEGVDTQCDNIYVEEEDGSEMPTLDVQYKQLETGMR